MNEDKLLRAVGELDDKVIEEAAPKKKNKSTKWVKWMSVAASVCIITVIGIAIVRQPSNPEKNEGKEKQTELATKKQPETGGVEMVPETGVFEGEDVDLFNYYIYTESGDYKVVEGKIEELKIEEVINKYLELSDISDITVEKVEFIHKDAEESEVDGLVFYVPASNTYEIYLRGDTFAEENAKGLVNTVVSYMRNEPGNDYVKIYFNNQQYLIDESMPDYGYYNFQMDIGSEGDENPWAENSEETVDISFVIIDEKGNPMKNITYSLEYVSGERGSYQPGYGITDSTGEFTRSVHPNATYILHLEKRNAVSYTNEIEPVVYEEMLVNLDVKEAFSKEIVWEEDKVTKINDRGESITIDISDIYDGNREEIFLQLFTEEGGQIQLGYPDKDGKFIWYDGVDGNYSLTLQKFELISGESNIKYAKTYIVELKDGEMNIIKEQEGEIEILE